MREVKDDTPSMEQTSVAVDLEEVERRACLFRAVETLPDDQRRVIILRFAEEKSIR